MVRFVQNEWLVVVPNQSAEITTHKRRTASSDYPLPMLHHDDWSVIVVRGRVAQNQALCELLRSVGMGLTTGDTLRTVGRHLGRGLPLAYKYQTWSVFEKSPQDTK